MKAAFLINNLNKGEFVGKAVASALAQTYPCDIIVSDYGSTDNSVQEIEKAIATAPRGAEHQVRNLPCPFSDQQGWTKMKSCNEHFFWMISQTDAPWIFQCSSDDYSLPDRVKVCMKEIEEHPCSIVATTMYFVKPGEEATVNSPRSGFPATSGYVQPGEGIWKMAYGSTIAGFYHPFLEKVGSADHSTMDVFYGFLAACDKGFYVVANPQHVHVMHADLNNMGFQGKMRAAEESGDHTKMMQLNELNRFQLFELYFSTLAKASQLYPMIHVNDKNAILQMVLDQAHGWMIERKKLHAEGITPGVM